MGLNFLLRNKVDTAKKFRTMEVGCIGLDGIPRKEMGLAQLVAALVEIDLEMTAHEGMDVVPEECSKGDNQRHLPGDGTFGLLKRTATQ